MDLRGWFHRLRAEITRRRKENHDRRGASRRDLVEVNLAEQRALLDWIEGQLDKVPLEKAQQTARPAAIAALEGQSVWDWIRSLDAEIDRRRVANHDKFGRHRWAPSEIKKAEQTDVELAPASVQKGGQPVRSA